MLICNPSKAISLKCFHWHKDDSSLSCEMSDIGPLRDGRWWIQQIWDDSADAGIMIRSHVTGAVHAFYLDHEERDRENDLMYYTFKPVDRKCPIKSVTIFND